MPIKTCSVQINTHSKSLSAMTPNEPPLFNKSLKREAGLLAVRRLLSMAVKYSINESNNGIAPIEV